jgi:hypothetical protein
MTMTWQGSKLLDYQLAADYNHLESRDCVCGRAKVIGELVCRDCLRFMPVDEGALISAMKPGEGIAEAIARAYAKMERAKRSYR